MNKKLIIVLVLVFMMGFGAVMVTPERTLEKYELVVRAFMHGATIHEVTDEQVVFSHDNHYISVYEFWYGISEFKKLSQK